MKGQPASQSDQFKFLPNDRIGYAAAEEDREILNKCFVSTGQLGALKNCDLSERIVLGRTGSGKTALLQRLGADEENVIEIRPESLALNYLSHDTILQYIVGLDVDLRLLFDLLWRHVITIEVIKRKYKIVDSSSKSGFLSRLSSMFERDPKKTEAIRYLEQWGDEFWEDTEFRIKEFTRKLKTQLEASGGSALKGILLRISGGQKISDEEKTEVEYHAKKVISKVQMHELGRIIELLAAILNDPQNKWYIVIDRLDEHWVNLHFRDLLIRALVDATNKFRQVRNLKIIIALRLDLFDTVLRSTRTSGQQGEKYEDLCMPLRWGRAELIEVMDLRIKKMVASRYTKRVVTHKDLLEPYVRGNRNKPTIDYMLQRTLMRPRDVIMFFNACIAKATDSPMITNSMLQDAEGQYSRERFESLLEEWDGELPNLGMFTDLLCDRFSEFPIGDLTQEQLYEICFNNVSRGFPTEDALAKAAQEFVGSELSFNDCRRQVVSQFYHVGLVGLRLSQAQAPSWSIEGPRSISSSEIRDSALVLVQPTFWRRLGIQEKPRPKPARKHQGEVVG